MSTTRLSWTGDRATLERADMVLTEMLYPPADAVSLVKADAAEADEATEWALHAYFETAPDPRTVETTLESAGLDLGAGTIEQLEDRDWVAHALEGLGVVVAGPFVVYGSHDADKAAQMPGHRIKVEANRAFGTGHHPTTSGCLEMLASIEHVKPARILDLGTGSGLLAIAARRLWPHATILGTDIDEPSVALAEQNAEENAAQGIVLRVADGIDGTVERDGPFDLVLANILAEPLIALAPRIEEVLARGGRVLLAGLLERQADAVIDAYAGSGLSVTRRGGDSWPILLLRRHESN